MRLRTYLVRRAIHTVITLLVVLILIFIIFRMMPGDPARFFIAPGQPPQVRDEICVSFGLCKWVSAPGNGYESSISAGAFGPYRVNVTVNDTAGNRGDYIFVYNKMPHFEDYRGSVWAARFDNITLQTGAMPTGLPSLPIAGVNQPITIDARVFPGRTAEPLTVTMTIRGPQGTTLTPATVPGSDYAYSWDVTPALEGFYTGTIVAENLTNANTTVMFGFAVNPPVSGFTLVEDKFYGTIPQFPPNSAVISVNVTSVAAPIQNVTANVVSPEGYLQGNVRLRHPQVVARRSLAEQFVIYFMNMLSGNFGSSFYSRTPVLDEIAKRIGPTLLLFGSAVVISYLLGILLGTVLAWRRGSKMELSAIVISLFFYSMPVFWFGLVLLWVFAFQLNWLPLGGIGGFNPDTGDPLTGLTLVGDVLKHMALPLGNLVILGLAGNVLLMRNSMLEVMGEDYILTAKAKGLKTRTVMYKHAARNALLPVVTALAISIGGVISGGVLTETIFSWPGMGYYLVQATLQQDYPSVQAAFFILAVLTILANTVADVLYAYLDPRVRL